MPKVSVIIPAYNAMEYLPQTVDSVLQQTCQDWEMIIVNDGSTDAIESWVASIPNPKIKLISQANGGISFARNQGIAASTGKFIAFLDGDDLWDQTKLTKQIEVLEQHSEVGLVYTWVNRIDEAGQSIGKPFTCNASGNIWSQLLEKNMIAPSSAMIRRGCLERVGCFDENLISSVEDWDLWLRIARHYNIEVLPETLLHYRECPTSASKNWAAMERGYKIVIEKAFATAPSAFRSQKGKSYGCAYLHLASQSLQSNLSDCKIAANYLQQAVSHAPQLKFSRAYQRLKFTVWIIQWFGIDAYHKWHGRFRGLRRYLFSMV